MPTAAIMKLVQQDARHVLAFAGRLDAAGAGQLWRPAMRAALAARGRPLLLDLHDVTWCDLAGATLLATLRSAHGGGVELVGGPERAGELVRRAASAMAHPAAAGRPRSGPRPARWRTALADRLVFLGEATLAALAAPRRRRMLRRADFARHAEQAGTRSLPLATMLGYLMGLILAFQSAIPMRQYGADLFVANLVSISLLRELGPLLAAVILAGRTGSAFAAEISTMKVNEELDALAAMGLHPMTMLVLPRLAAVMLVMPAMTVVLEIAGLCGLVTVMLGFGFPLAAITGQIQYAATASDLFQGLLKSVVFGAAIAAIGCRAGMTTGAGPRAVGLSATAAVVGGIVATIALDGLFALLFYRLGV